jgi:hypothetical protein
MVRAKIYLIRRIYMKKKSWLRVIVALGILGACSCGFLDKNSQDTVTIKFNSETAITLQSGGANSSNFSGTFECTKPPLFTANVFNSDNKTVFDFFSVELLKPTTDIVTGEFNGKITLPKRLVPGNYTFYISALAGSAAGYDSLPLVITAPDSTMKVEVDSATFDLNGAPISCLIDMDNKALYNAEKVGDHLSSIDLCCFYSNDDHANKMYSPAQLKASEPKLFAVLPGTVNSTKFYKVSDVAYSSISKGSQIDSLWDESKATTTSVTAEKKDLFIVKTDLGNKALLFIDVFDRDSTSTNVRVRLRFAW